MTELARATWQIWCEMSPYLVFGLLIAGLIHVFISKEQIARHIGDSNLGSVVKASLFGIPLPLCSCGVLPTGLSLYREGGSKGAVVSFFISTPQTGVDSILVTYGFLGPVFAVIRPVAAFAGGVLGGVITNLWAARDRKEKVSTPPHQSQKKGPWLVESLRYGFVDFLYNFAHYLVAGVLIAGAISHFMPKDFFSSVVGTGFLSMLAMILVGLPLYVCSTASVPVAYAMMLKGLSPGAALVFLMVGPATNMATITSMAGVMGARVVTIYLGTIVATALVFGGVMNTLNNALPGWFVLNGAQTVAMLPASLQVASGLVMAAFTLYAIYKRMTARFSESRTACTTETCACEAGDKEVLTFEILNMNCSHCASKVEGMIKSIPGVTGVSIDLLKGEGVVVGQGIDVDAIASTLSNGGYPARPKRG